MADMYTSLSACRSYLYNVARHADLHEPSNHECAGVVLYCAEKATQISLDAIQILGGNGYSKFYLSKDLMGKSQFCLIIKITVVVEIVPKNKINICM